MNRRILTLSCTDRLGIISKLVSTQGHCLNDLLHRVQSGALPMDVAAVVSNHETLSPMTQWDQLPFHYWPANHKEAQEEQIASIFEKEGIDLVILARYMQILWK